MKKFESWEDRHEASKPILHIYTQCKSFTNYLRLVNWEWDVTKTSRKRLRQQPSTITYMIPSNHKTMNANGIWNSSKTLNDKTDEVHVFRNQIIMN